MRTGGLLSWVLLAGLLGACAGVDKGRYGVTSLEIEGNQAVDEAAIEACLITRERDSFGLTLGLSSPSCGKPPFDSSPPTLRLWRWPWAEWPTFNEAVFDQDVERVKRFYRARGYYSARVVSVKVTPPEASRPGTVGSCNPDKEKCKVSLSILVEEGAGTFVQSIDVQGLEHLPSPVRERAVRSLPLRVGALIDEAEYERGKQELIKQLKAEGYAGAKASGRVEVATAARRASVRYTVEPGPLCRFGSVSIKGNGTLSAQVIREAADIRQGERYDPEVLKEAQAEVFAMGSFSAAELHETLDLRRGVVDVELNVTPLPRDAFRVSVGVTSGAQQRTATSELASVPQWDAHVATSYERRHLFGTLLRARIEERPRIIFNRDFPRLMTPQFGNIVKLGLTQPGLLEPRTESFFDSAWDYGPEPYLQFIRSDIFARIGARRAFLRRKLGVTLALQQDLFLVDQSPGNVSSDGEPQTSYGYSYVEQEVHLDLRDNRVRPSLGAYFGVNTSEAVRWAGSDWTAFRVLPEARGFLPLFWDVVWASRVTLGAIFITDHSDRLDPVSAELGPTTYRLRGGGANSNRGFLAGTLGAGYTGGIRRWEASTELRFPIGGSFVLAGFFDVGDVNDADTFRFDHLNATVGHGFRFYTVLGAIRLDFGYRIPGLQRADGSDGIEDDAETLPFIGVPGAIHLTIGDAY
jgi:outer membrane protein assembly factor BamA